MHEGRLRHGQTDGADGSPEFLLSIAISQEQLRVRDSYSLMLDEPRSEIAYLHSLSLATDLNSLLWFRLSTLHSV